MVSLNISNEKKRRVEHSMPVLKLNIAYERIVSPTDEFHSNVLNITSGRENLGVLQMWRWYGKKEYTSSFETTKIKTSLICIVKLW